jgi:hypothetical protein
MLLIALLLAAEPLPPVPVMPAAEIAPAPHADAPWLLRLPPEAIGVAPGKKIDAEDGVYLWLPPTAELRGLFVCRRLGIEDELVTSPIVRAALAAHGIGIVYHRGTLDATFMFWKDGSTQPALFLKALDVLAERTDRADIRRVPWLTAGHSTAGIWCRNIAWWQPERVAAVLHLKSGNWHQAGTIPPGGRPPGVPLIAVNGQLETFGPEGGLRKEYGRQTQWRLGLTDLQRLRADGHLAAMVVQPGDDHFFGAPELERFTAAAIACVARHRLPESLPRGDAPVPVRAVRAEDGWLVDPDYLAPTHAPAPFADYTGDRAAAMWLLDRELVLAQRDFQGDLAAWQVLDNPTAQWLPDGDGWTFRAQAAWSEVIPEKFGGPDAGKPVTHADGPIRLRVRHNQPVAQVAPDTFRLLRPADKIQIAAFHPGDATHRSTIRWGGIDMPKPAKDAAAQTIEITAVPDLAPGAAPLPLTATVSSGLPVTWQVVYGPVRIVDGVLHVEPLPPGVGGELPCRIVAWQLGRRVAPAVLPASAVGTFSVRVP